MVEFYYVDNKKKDNKYMSCLVQFKCCYVEI